MNMLTLVRGLPGYGKSTFAKTVLYLDRHYEADMFFIQHDGSYKYNPSLIKSAHEWCQTSTRCALYSGHNVVVSNTFTTIKEMEPYFNMARMANIKINVYRMTKSFGSIHNVPEDVIDRMRNRFEDYEDEIKI